jgi:hypothetical protein
MTNQGKREQVERRLAERRAARKAQQARHEEERARLAAEQERELARQREEELDKNAKMLPLPNPPPIITTNTASATTLNPATTTLASRPVVLRPLSHAEVGSQQRLLLGRVRVEDLLGSVIIVESNGQQFHLSVEHADTRLHRATGLEAQLTLREVR